MTNIHLKQDMSSKDLAILNSEMDTAKKNKGVAFVLWFFTGIFGGHRFYSGDMGIAIGMLSFTILNFLFLGWLTLGVTFFILSLWVLIDAFFLSGRIDQANLQIERKIITNLGLGSPRTNN